MIPPRPSLASLTALTALVACERVPVQSGLPERDANEIVLMLEETGIATHKEREAATGGSGRETQWSITVGASDAGRAFQVLSDHAMPRESPPGFSEVLSGDSLIPTAAEERVRHRQALSGEIARTLESVRGIVEARVHLGLPERVELPTAEEPAVRPTASVLIKSSTVAPPLAVEDVARLVAGAVPGLEPAAVSVVVIPEPPPARPPSDGLVSVAGVRVSPSSVGGMRAMLGAALAAIVLLAAGLVGTTIRRRFPRVQKGPA